MSLRLEGYGFQPYVHGWMGKSGGEYAMATARGGATVASTDPLGTRPLYSDPGGRWVASDHRFFPGEAFDRLPPPGLALGVDLGGRRIIKKKNYEDAAGRLA